MPDLRAVFFDLAGTLITVRGGIGHQYSSLAREFGVEVAPRAIDEAFANVFGAAGGMVFAESGDDAIAALEKGFWREIVRASFARAAPRASFGSRFEEYFDKLFRHFATATPWEVYPDVAPTLDALKEHRLLLGLVTNFDRRVFSLVEALGLGHYFDSVTVPSTAGAAKPERAIFDHALSIHGLRANQAVQVGDSFAEDVEGARAAGMRAILLDRKGRTGPEIIGSLVQLPALLGLRASPSARQ